MYAIICTDGKRVKLVGFSNYCITWDSYEEALERAYAKWLHNPEYFYAVIKRG